MSNFDALIQDLVIANRILASEEVVDAYGHVSVRHPEPSDRPKSYEGRRRSDGTEDPPPRRH